jgi:pilus assembly protein CpaF
VVLDYDERSLSSTLPALPDPLLAARVVYDAVAGFGPLQRYLDDPEVEELWINEPGRVFIARRGRSELTTTILDDGQVRDLVERMLKSTGRRVDLSTPFAQPSQHVQAAHLQGMALPCLRRQGGGLRAERDRRCRMRPC